MEIADRGRRMVAGHGRARPPSAPAGTDRRQPACSILAYHRFGPVVADGMTVTTATFAAQLQALSDGGYTVVRSAAWSSTVAAAVPTCPHGPW